MKTGTGIVKVKPVVVGMCGHEVNRALVYKVKGGRRRVWYCQVDQDYTNKGKVIYKRVGGKALA